MQQCMHIEPTLVENWANLIGPGNSEERWIE